MAALVEAQTHHRVAGLEQRQVCRDVGVGAGVRLHVRGLGAEERLDPLAREVFGLVDEAITAVVALPRVSLGVLVGEH